jgi:hypothetical protein
MDSNLLKTLRKMSDVDFQELTHNVNIARKMRRITHEYVLDPQDWADELGVQIPEVNSMMNAAANFDIRLVAKIDVYEKKLIENDDNEIEEEIEEEEVFEKEEEVFEKEEDGEEEEEDQVDADEKAIVEAEKNAETDEKAEADDLDAKGGGADSKEEQDDRDAKKDEPTS